MIEKKHSSALLTPLSRPSCDIDLRREIPVPRATRKGPFVTLPALTEAKLALYTAMRAARIGKAELARWLNRHLPQVDRLLDRR
jgi:antitoxin HicB